VLGVQCYGVISEEVLSELSVEIDAALDSEERDIHEQVFGIPSSPKLNNFVG